MEKKNIFEELYALNVNERTEKRKDNSGRELTYLSWPWAVREMTKRYPDWVYEIVKTDGLPYAFDPMTGYMVTTRVTAGGMTREMWLPVMDGANHAMKSEPYVIHTKYKDVTVQAATMFDVNKAIMRCLVKNMAMFGLGLYIYAGEDLPETDTEEEDAAPASADAEIGKLRGAILDLADGDVNRVNAFLARAVKGAPKLDDLNLEQLRAVHQILASRVSGKETDHE
jgi:hypothetical protein